MPELFITQKNIFVKKLSIVICVYNEEQNIQPLIAQIEQSIQDIEFEVIYVDDGSSDGTVKEIKQAAKPWIKLIELRKNYGQSTALAAGIDNAAGEFVVTMDGDLQNDPSDIPVMLHKCEQEGWDMIAGFRTKRQDGFLLRKIPSLIANYVIRLTTGVKIKDYGCTLKIFKKEIVKHIKLYGELHRFIPVLVNLEGGKITQMKVKHHARKFGKSKYGLNRTFKVMSDLLLMVFMKKYMQKPMHLFGSGGLVLFIIGVGINLYLLVLKIMGHDIWGKPLLLLGILLLLTGIQLISVGIITEVLMRTYYESQQKRTYNIKQITIGDIPVEPTSENSP